jgi:hypothetical protein
MPVPDPSQYPFVVPVQKSLPAYWSFDIASGLTPTSPNYYLTVRDEASVVRHLLKNGDMRIVGDRLIVALTSDDLKHLPLGAHHVRLDIVDSPDPSAADQTGQALRAYEFPIVILP